MKTFAIQDAIIARAIRAGTLSVSKQEGRMGAFWAIEDEQGLIEVALSPEEAAARVAEIQQRLAA